jgi:hypothetical protein
VVVLLAPGGCTSTVKVVDKILLSGGCVNEFVMCALPIWAELNPSCFLFLPVEVIQTHVLMCIIMYVATNIVCIACTYMLQCMAIWSYGPLCLSCPICCFVLLFIFNV